MLKRIVKQIRKLSFRLNSKVHIQRLADGRAMLNIGCGSRFHHEWTNIDHMPRSRRVFKHDIRRKLPFEAGIFDVVYHSHLIEHLIPTDGQKLLGECLRVLKPHGILRVVTPDLEFSARLYLTALQKIEESSTSENHEHYEWALYNLIDQTVRTESGGLIKYLLQRKNLYDFDYMVENAGGSTLVETRDWLLRNKFQNHPVSVGANEEQAFRRTGELHLWMYDRYSMRLLLKEIGFTDIRLMSIEQSSVENWASFNLDISKDGIIYKTKSLVFEARKPSESL